MADDDEAAPPPPPPTRDPPKRQRPLPPLPSLGTYLRARPDRLLTGPPPPPPPPRHPMGPPPPKRPQLLLSPGTFLCDRPDRLLAGPPPDPCHPVDPPPPRLTSPLVRTSLRAFLPLPPFDISLRALANRLLAGPPLGTGPQVRIPFDTSLLALTDRLLAGPPPGPHHPLDPPPPGTGPRVRTSCRRFPPPQVRSPSMGTSSSPSSVEVSSDDLAVSAAAMLANIERSIWSAGEEAAAEAAVMAAATAPELELPVLATSDSCLSIQEHLSSTSSQTSAEDTNSDPAADVNTTGDPELSEQSQAKFPYPSSCSLRMQGSSDDSTVSEAASLGAVVVAAEAGEPELPSSVLSDSCLSSSPSPSRTLAGDTNSDPAADLNTAGDPVVSGRSSGSNWSCSDEEEK